MTKILVTFASSHGATADIAQTIGAVIRENGLNVDTIRMEEVESLEQYDAIVLGSAIYIGEWLKLARDFLIAYRDVLQQKYLWIFSSGPTGEGKPTELLDGLVLPESLETIVDELQPRDVVVFGGKIDLRRLKKNERIIVQDEGIPKGDFRNWHAIKFWAQQIADALKTVALDEPTTSAVVKVEDTA